MLLNAATAQHIINKILCNKICVNMHKCGQNNRTQVIDGQMTISLNILKMQQKMTKHKNKKYAKNCKADKIYTRQTIDLKSQ